MKYHIIINESAALNNISLNSIGQAFEEIQSIDPTFIKSGHFEACNNSDYIYSIEKFEFSEEEISYLKLKYNNLNFSTQIRNITTHRI